MQNDIKIGIIVGIVVVAAAAVLFVTQGRDQDKPVVEVPPPVQAEPAPPAPAPMPVPEPVLEPVVVEPKLQGQPETGVAAPETSGVTVTVPPAAEEKPAVIPPAPEPEPEVRQPRYHTVATGDNLYIISEQYYGSGKFADSVYEANRNLIKNKDILQVGWKLRIPYPEEIVKK